MAFSFSLKSKKRLNSIDPESGMESFQEHDVDIAHLKILDPSRMDVNAASSNQRIDKQVWI